MISQTLPKKAFWLSKKIGQAIWDYAMIEDGDKVLVAVSGGKDSMTLLRILEWRRHFMPISFDIMALHVASADHCGGSEDPAVLERLFQEWGISYKIVPLDVTVTLNEKKPGLSCFWCAWNRRKIFFQEADALGCNKIAVGHHKDDIAETMLMNLFFQAEISTMSPNQEFFDGKFRIVRPLCYLEEDAISRFAQDMGFPEQVCNCPAGKRSNRRLMKDIIRNVKTECPQVKDNIFHSLKRIKREYLP